MFNQYDPDIDLGGPLNLHLTRYYSSGFKQVGVSANFGDNWRHNFDWQLAIIDATMHVVDHKGHTIQFINNGADWNLVGKADAVYQLVENGGFYTLLDPRSKLSYRFNSAGQLSSISDGKGNVHSLSYSSGPLTQVADGLGRYLNFAYDANNHLTSVNDGLGRVVSFTYTGSYLSSVTDLAGNTTLYNYSTANSNLTGWGLLTTMIRPQGNIPYEHGYCFADRFSSSETDSDGNKTIFRYPGATQTTIEDPLGNVRTHTHTPKGELSDNQDQAGHSTVIGYDAAGRRNVMTDKTGNTVSNTYDSLSGRLTSITVLKGTSYKKAMQMSCGIRLKKILN